MNELDSVPDIKECARGPFCYKDKGYQNDLCPENESCTKFKSGGKTRAQCLPSHYCGFKPDGVRKYNNGVIGRTITCPGGSREPAFVKEAFEAYKKEDQEQVKSITGLEINFSGAKCLIKMPSLGKHQTSGSCAVKAAEKKCKWF